MKRYKVNKVENGKQTTLASFNTANEAIDYATAWSNEMVKAAKLKPAELDELRKTITREVTTLKIF